MQVRLGRKRRCLRWAGLVLLLFCGLLWLADVLDPLPLPKDDMARVVLAQDGTPLWRFADHNGVWRYPIRIDQVSPYYLEARSAERRVGKECRSRWSPHH